MEDREFRVMTQQEIIMFQQGGQQPQSVESTETLRVLMAIGVFVFVLVVIYQQRELQANWPKFYAAKDTQANKGPQ
jgi:hypothetical protein